MNAVELLSPNLLKQAARHLLDYSAHLKDRQHSDVSLQVLALSKSLMGAAEIEVATCMGRAADLPTGDLPQRTKL
jgi:hypothetical protein